MNILVLGLGNILLSDEGVGVRIVEALDASHELPDGVEVLDGGTSGMDLLDMVAERDCLIVADAVNAAGPAGRLIRLEGENIKVLFETRFSPHQLGLSDMLAALCLIDKAPRRVVIIGVVPQNLSLGLELSPAVAGGRNAAVTMIVDELTRLGAAPTPRLHQVIATMCIAVPAEVISVDGPMALVDVYGKRFSVSLMMMSETVQAGDFVALQAQRYAVTRIAREDAQAAKRFFEDLFPELAAAAQAARVA